MVREVRAVWVKPNQLNTPNLPNSPEQAANMLLTFCQMETFLLKRQNEAILFGDFALFLEFGHLEIVIS